MAGPSLRSRSAGPGARVGWSVLISVLPQADRSVAYRRLQKISARVDGMLIAEGIVSSE